MNKTIKITEENLESLSALLLSVSVLDDKPHVCHIKPATKSRSVLQNSCSHAWYNKVANVLEEHHASYIKCQCKLHIGVDILRADPDYNEACTMAIDPYTYEQKIKIMRIFPVTSLFSTRQFTSYLRAVRLNYAGRVDLRFSDEMPLDLR